MACEILIHRNKNNYNHADINVDRSGVYKKGYIVIIKDYPTIWGKEELFSAGNFVIARIIDSNMNEIEEYLANWEIECEFKKTYSNISSDIFRYKIISKNPGKNGYGNLNDNKINVLSDRYNISIHSSSKNEVVIKFKVFNVIKSEEFFDYKNIDGLQFTENSYDELTGNHEIVINWSKFKINIINRDKFSKKISEIILQRGGNIISSDSINENIVFNISRDKVISYLLDEIYNKIRKNNNLFRRKYYLDNNYVDSLIEYSTNNNGQSKDITKIDFLSNIKSHLDREDL